MASYNLLKVGSYNQKETTMMPSIYIFTVSNQKTPRIALNFLMYGKRYIHI